MIEDCWWTGEIINRCPLSEEFPTSPFMCYEVRWDNGEFERMSPWDMEPVNENRKLFSGGLFVIHRQLPFYVPFNYWAIYW